MGWFTFSSVLTFLLPMGPWWQRLIEFVLRWVQDIISTSQPTFWYSFAETLSLIALMILPWSVGCLLGLLAAQYAKRFVKNSETEENECRASFRLTLRGIFFAVMVSAVLTSWLSTTVRNWHMREVTHQAHFAELFKSSFSTGTVELLAEPTIIEDHTLLKRSQNSSGISQYRVTAPISKNGNELWAVWTYLCNDNFSGTVFKFGYAEAGSPTELPPPPFPVTEYLVYPTVMLRDGEPLLTSQASVVAAPTVAKSGDTISIVAKTDAGMVCDLVIRPIQALTLPPAQIRAPQNGIVSWTVTIDPAYVGTQLGYEFQSRTNMLYRAKVVSGIVTLKQSDDISNGLDQ